MLRDPAIHLEVGPQVYAPAEDSFLMLSALKMRGDERALEMGCGSGFLSLHMAKVGASVLAVDIDPQALSNTKKNAEHNGLEIETTLSDLFHDVKGTFDLIVFNPPYLRGSVESQEDLCWAGGEKGTEVTTRFLNGAKDHLKTGGRVLILISNDVDQDALGAALKDWERRDLASKSLFFEELKVLELTL